MDLASARRKGVRRDRRDALPNGSGPFGRLDISDEGDS